MILAIQFIASFFLLFGIGFRILKPLRLLTGISAENVVDRDGLARWVGNALMVFAFVYILLATLLQILAIDLSGTSPLIIALVSIYLLGQGVLVSYIMGTGKYVRRTALSPRQIDTDDK
jgi:hypothetical protein